MKSQEQQLKEHEIYKHISEGYKQSKTIDNVKNPDITLNEELKDSSIYLLNKGYESTTKEVKRGTLDNE